MVRALDLNFLGRSGAIAADLIEGPGGLAIVDPGPASCVDGLRASLARYGHRLEDVDAVLVTHIHLDHSGGVGVLARSNPRLQVYVHRRGAPHVVDPSKLVSSASRLYGDRMGPLWGEILPVPTENVHALDGGEVLEIAGVEVPVAYTPGHAVHHVSYFETSRGTAFAGDTGGIRVGEPLLVLPPTPPPDIDLEQWSESLQHLRAWRPAALMIAHFGFVEAPAHHFDDLERRLGRYADLVRQSLDVAGPDEYRIAFFRAGVMDDLHSALPADVAEEVARGYMIGESWHGLARYWRKRAPRDDGSR